MISNLIETLSGIENRLNNHWSQACLPAVTPVIAEAMEMIEKMRAMVNKCHDHSFATVSVNHCNYRRIRQIIHCRRTFSAKLWPDPATLDHAAQHFYRYDLMVYLGLSYFAIRVLKYSSYRDNDENLPSFSSLVPNIDDDVLNAFIQNMEGTRPDWLVELKQTKYLVLYNECLNQLEEATMPLLSLHPLVGVVVK